MLVLVALGWGLFWSSIFKTVACGRSGGDVLHGVIRHGELRSIYAVRPPTIVRIVEFAVVIATILASHAFFTQSIDCVASHRIPFSDRLQQIVFASPRRIRGSITQRGCAGAISREIAAIRPLRQPPQRDPRTPVAAHRDSEPGPADDQTKVSEPGRCLGDRDRAAGIGLAGDSLDRMWPRA